MRACDPARRRAGRPGRCARASSTRRPRRDLAFLRPAGVQPSFPPRQREQRRPLSRRSRRLARSDASSGPESRAAVYERARGGVTPQLASFGRWKSASSFADLGAASQALGHSDLSTTAAIYGHYDLGDLETGNGRSRACSPGTRRASRLKPFQSTGPENGSTEPTMEAAGIEPASRSRRPTAGEPHFRASYRSALRSGYSRPHSWPQRCC
jgi:hypothetical protein